MVASGGYFSRVSALSDFTFVDDDDDDPVLLDAAGLAVDTWRENYPYEARM